MINGNWDGSAALEFHDATKHSYISIRTDHHYLDWENKPLLYKVYPGLDPILLTVEPRLGRENALRAVEKYSDANSRGSLSCPDLTEVLYLGAGLTKVMKWGSEEYYHRAASCAGALYPIEVYVVVGELPGLGVGVYHFCPGDFALRLLREGDFRGALADMAVESDAVRSSAATLVLTAIFWRSAWKYRARSYRYCFWDSGTILANLLAASSKTGSKLITGFLDAEVNHLLGVNPEREAALCLLPIGNSASARTGGSRLDPISFESIPLSREEVEYKGIQELHSASSLKGLEDLKQWSNARVETPKPSRVEGSIPLKPLSENGLSKLSLWETVLRRGSTRRFARKHFSLENLSTILERSTRGIPADFLSGPHQSLVDVYLIVNAIEGLREGAYYLNRSEGLLELLKQGGFRQTSGYLCLEQQLAADASAVVYFMADLGRVLGVFGNRGYRIAHLEAGILGGKMYLCAYALGLGATGLTFFDDDVEEFFSPHAKGKSCLFVVALGVPAYRTRPISWSHVPLRDPVVERLISMAKTHA